MHECQREKNLSDYKVYRQLAYNVWKQMFTHILEFHRHWGHWVFLHYRQLFTESGMDQLASLTGAKVDHVFPDKSLHRSRPQELAGPEIDYIYQELCALAEYRWINANESRS